MACLGSPCDKGTDGATEGTCVEDDKVQWSYVGPKKGTYEPTTSYTYVGEGQGSFDKEEVPVRPDWKMKRSCLCCLCASIILGLLLTMLLLWPFSTSYDCSSNYSTWQRDWSDGQKEWCCANERRGCVAHAAPQRFDCGEGASNWRHTWSRDKKSWCCSHYRRGCEVSSSNGTTPTFDCTEGSPAGWTVGKGAWCCLHEQKGCEEHSRSSGANPAAAPAHHHPAAAPAQTPAHDCNAGFANWHDGWSIAKKAWCCEHAHRGCPELPPGGNTDVVFDCEANAAEASTGWSPRKRTYCCSHAGKGCGVVTTSPMPTHHPFDCHAGVGAWVTGWSEAKKIWCYEHNQFPKTADATPAPTGPNLHCDTKCSYNGHWDTCATHVQWAVDHGRESTCGAAYDDVLQTCPECSVCAASDTGCHLPSQPHPEHGHEEKFDCLAGFANWQSAWSHDKKAWCCHKYGRGCESHRRDGDMYDCDAGFANWRHAWSHSKRTWCCIHKDRACDE